MHTPTNSFTNRNMSIEFVAANGDVASKKQRQHMPLRLKSRSSTDKNVDVDTIAAFKHSPSFQPQHFRTTRPVMEQYCTCVTGKRDMISSDMKELGTRNILDCSAYSAHKGWLARCFPIEIYTLKKPLFKQFPDVSGFVLSSSRVQHALEETVRKIGEGSNTKKLNESQIELKVNKEAQLIFKKMKASLSAGFIKLAAWFLTKFLGLFINTVQVSEAQMMVLEQTAQKGLPMIYLPMHRSHLDYILTTLTLFHFGIRSPYVAAGDNLDIPFFNWLMRGLGGFFIRRRLDRKAGQKDILYRAILHEYMAELLRQGEGLEFFIEGGRSRTGRAIIPKGGLLSVLVDACNAGDISDAYIVPASFSYERLIDGNFNREQMGLPKVSESFGGALRAIFRVVFGNYGSIRLNFAPPFSLREFLNFTNNNPYPASLTPSSSSYSPSDRGMSYPNLSQPVLSNGQNELNTRMLVKALADHTVYTSDHSTTPMSTHITAFLLLTRHRQGACIKELSKSITWVTRELQALRVDVGFCGKPEDVLLHAQKVLSSDLISIVWKEELDDFILYPNLSLPFVFELSYYSNQVTTHFILESLLACAVMCESSLSVFNLLTSNPHQESTFTREKLFETAKEICLLIQSEYIFVPPCNELSNALSETLDSFITRELLSLEEMDNDFAFSGGNVFRASNLAKSLDIDEEDSPGAYVADQSLKVNINGTGVPERLHFLVSVAGPILESQFVVCKFVLSDLQGETPESEFYGALGEFARSRVFEGTAIFSESSAVLNLKSAVKSLEELKLMYSYKSANLTIVGSCEQADSLEILQNYLDLLGRILY